MDLEILLGWTGGYNWYVSSLNSFHLAFAVLVHCLNFHAQILGNMPLLFCYVGTDD